MKDSEYIWEIPLEIFGESFIIGVRDYYEKSPFKGSPYNCDSDIDFSGYCEISFDILDSMGYYVEIDLDNHKIERIIKDYVKGLEDYSP